MKFIPVEPKKPVREELISEDGCFKLTVDHSQEDNPWYSISTEKIEICPGFGCAQTVIEAMEKALKSLNTNAQTIATRIKQIEKMIAEETQKESAAK